MKETLIVIIPILFVVILVLILSKKRNKNKNSGPTIFNSEANVNKEIVITNKMYSINDLILELVNDQSIELLLDKEIPVLYGNYIKAKELFNSVFIKMSTNIISIKINHTITDNICALVISINYKGHFIEDENIKLLLNELNGDSNTESNLEGTNILTIRLNQALAYQKEKNELEAAVKVKLSKKAFNKDYKRKKVLIVDDNLISLKVSKRLIESYNIEVDEVSTGEACINYINSGEKYDLIFMDDMMPNMSGTETFSLLKQNQSFNTPVIALTANTIEGEKEKYMNIGFNGYLTKPIVESDLLEILDSFLK